MAKQLYLFRHGPTSAPAGSMVGRTDPPLSGRGLSRMASHKPYVQKVEQWFCSPMLRARQTMEALREIGAGPLVIDQDPRLREIDFGRWEMKTFSDIATVEPEKISEWARYTDFVFPEGEAVNDFVARVREMYALFAAAQCDRIGVVTHGGVIRTMICLALGLSVRDYLLFEVQPASLTILVLYSEGALLKGLNL